MPWLETVKAPNILIVGASRGIGLGFVRHLLTVYPHSQMVAASRAPARSEALQALVQAHPDRLHTVPLDLTDEAQIQGAIARISSAMPQLHLVINCVGLLHDGDLQPEKRLEQLNAAHLTRYFQVNSIGAILLAKHLLPLLKHRDRSLFATISAKVGSIGDNYLGGWYGYRAAKAALNMFLHTAAIEYGRRSPQTLVVMLHPGTTDTQLSAPFQRNVPPAKLFPVERTVRQLLAVLDHLTEADSGQFFAWDGSRLPW